MTHRGSYPAIQTPILCKPSYIQASRPNKDVFGQFHYRERLSRRALVGTYIITVVSSELTFCSMTSIDIRKTISQRDRNPKFGDPVGINQCCFYRRLAAGLESVYIS